MQVVKGRVQAARSYLNVPTPPASSRSCTPSWRFLPTQRMANARRIWPCATMRTSPLATSSGDFPMTGLWYFSRISSMMRSRRSVISSGPLITRSVWISTPAHRFNQPSYEDLLSPGTAILPDVPVALVPLGVALLSDVRARHALVVAIVPLPDIFVDFD